MAIGSIPVTGLTISAVRKTSSAKGTQDHQTDSDIKEGHFGAVGTVPIIAVITPILPYPPDSGSRIRIFNICKLLSEKGMRLFLFAFDRVVAPSALDSLKPYFKEIRLASDSQLSNKGSYPVRVTQKILGPPFPPRPLLRDAILKALEEWKPDFIQLEKTISAAYLPLVFWNKACVRIVLEEGGVHHLAYEREARIQQGWLSRAKHFRRAQRLKSYESELVGKTDAVVSVSNEETNLIKSLSKRAFTICVPNGIDNETIKESVSPANEREMAVFFCGNLNYSPNRDAVSFYLRTVHKILYRRGQNIKFVVAGGGRDKALADEMGKEKHCDYLGYVENIHELFKKYAIFVNPMRLGGGTRLKMLEAMGFGMACVSTTIGAEGLDVKHGEHFLVADDPESMAESIAELISNLELAVKIGNNARQLVADRYTWNHCLESLIEFYKSSSSG